ncbi:MAG: hypothetical protein II428_06905, partial [Muribaculaceae bacterium]|nr:hypothetical protein [Muribaculaceae bacterium]
IVSQRANLVILCEKSGLNCVKNYYLPCRGCPFADWACFREKAIRRDLPQNFCRRQDFWRTLPSSCGRGDLILLFCFCQITERPSIYATILDIYYRLLK